MSQRMCATHHQHVATNCCNSSDLAAEWWLAAPDLAAERWLAAPVTDLAAKRKLAAPVTEGV